MLIGVRHFADKDKVVWGGEERRWTLYKSLNLVKLDNWDIPFVSE